MKLSIATAYVCVVFGPFGLFCLVWTFLFVGRAEFLSAVVALGFSAFTLGLVAMVAVVASRKVKPRISRHDGGITLRPDVRVDRSLMASTIGVFLGMVVYAVFAPLDMLTIPTPGDDRKYFMVACAAGAVVGLFTLRHVVRQRGMSLLRLSTTGIELGSTISTAKRSWDDVDDIADRPRNGRKPTGATFITGADGRTLTIPSDWYTPGGQVLRDLMLLYWQHPDLRPELADGRAVERLKANV
ncbi:hypothetical protein [Mycolicibacterium goodii]|uniref:hypothetical protein n=1 Tax=Mycolicibacterium goodii TaxID=134601 RepID=UPI0006730BB4